MYCPRNAVVDLLCVAGTSTCDTSIDPGKGTPWYSMVGQFFELTTPHYLGGRYTSIYIALLLSASRELTWYWHHVPRITPSGNFSRSFRLMPRVPLLGSGQSLTARTRVAVHCRDRTVPGTNPFGRASLERYPAYGRMPLHDTRGSSPFPNFR